MRGNGFKLKKGRFRLDMRRKVFPDSGVSHWHRLRKEAEAAPSLEMFRARLGGALSLREGDPAHGGVLEQHLPSNPTHSRILHILPNSLVQFSIQCFTRDAKPSLELCLVFTFFPLVLAPAPGSSRVSPDGCPREEASLHNSFAILCLILRCKSHSVKSVK